MEKISRTWSLMAECWRLLKAEKSLLVFPLISGFCCLLLLASFAIPIFVTGAWHPPGQDAQQSHVVAYYGTLFAFYVANYFVVIFFNAALIACAATRLGGGTPSIGDGLRVAASRLPAIAGWALVSATVGLLLRIIEDKSDKVGQIVAGVLGMAWTAVSALVVPVLVLEQKGPFAALRDSATLLKKTWGEQLTSHFSFGLIFFVLFIPAIVLVALGGYFGGAVGGIACAVVAAVYLIVLALIQSALQAIFQTALYLYARDGRVEGFRTEVLDSALN